jgi:hypothetical protein
MNPSKPTGRSIIAEIIASLLGFLRMGGTGAVYGRGGKRWHYVRTRSWQSVRRQVPKAMLRFIEREAK